MALIRSIASGAVGSLLVANLVQHPTNGGALMIASFRVGTVQGFWSWTVFIVLTVLTWVILQVLGYSSPR